MTDDQIARFKALHPRVSIGNDTPAWMKARRTWYGATLDGRYHGRPRCRGWEGALRKAEALSAEIRAAEAQAICA